MTKRKFLWLIAAAGFVLLLVDTWFVEMWDVNRMPMVIGIVALFYCSMGWFAYAGGACIVIVNKLMKIYENLPEA